MSVRLQTQKLLLLSLLSSVWASWATWIPIKPFAAYKLEWRCFLEYGILNFRLQIQEHTRFPGQEENMPSSAFPVCCPQTNVIMNDVLLTVGNNAIHTMLSRCPHTNWSTGLKVTGGSRKKNKTALKPHLVNKQKIERQKSYQAAIYISERLGGIMSSWWHANESSGTRRSAIWYPSPSAALNINWNANIGKWLYFRRTDKIMKSPLIYRKPF